MGRDPAHGVDGDGAAGHGAVVEAAEVGPLLRDDGWVVEGGLGDFGGERVDAGGGDAGDLGHGLGRVGGAEVAVGDVVEDGAVGDARVAVCGSQVGFHAFAVPRGELARAAVDDLRLAVFVAEEEAVLGEAGSSFTRQGALVKRAR